MSLDKSSTSGVPDTLVKTIAREEKNKDVSRYDNFRLYRVYLETDEHVQLFKHLDGVCSGYSFYGHARCPNQYLTIMVTADKISHMADLLKRFQVKGEILNYNIQKNIDNEVSTIKPSTTDPSALDWTHYYHLETINKWLDLLVAKHDFITALNIGKSYENRDICGIKFSKKSGNTGIFVEGGIHGREWISPAVSTFLINQLINSTDPDVQFLAENFDWYFFPITNPDGYVYTFDGDRFWRKTRKPNGICCGADLNRNFDSYWSGPGSSSNPCANDYAGHSLNSEPETAVLTKFLQDNVESAKIRTFMSLHSFSQLVMFPYGYSGERVDNYDDLKAFGEKAVAEMAKLYGTIYKTGSIHETIYPSSGGSMDYVKAKLNIPIAYTFELRGPPDGTCMFMLPADQIEPTGWETLAAFKSIIMDAFKKGYYN